MTERSRGTFDAPRRRTPRRPRRPRSIALAAVIAGAAATMACTSTTPAPTRAQVASAIAARADVSASQADCAARRLVGTLDAPSLRAVVDVPRRSPLPGALTPPVVAALVGCTLGAES